MNRLKLIVGLIFIFSLSAWGKRSKDVTFDQNDFNRKESIAEYLYEYDAVMQWTTDSMVNASTAEHARLGSDWFCFKTGDRNWHAIYGKYENGNFDLVFHYVVDTTFKVKRVSEKVDTVILNGYARALQTATKYVKPHRDSVNLRFNQYMRLNDDKTYDVWILPALQPNKWAAYGKEFILKVDPSGNKIMADNSYYDTDFRGFELKEPREIWIDQTKLEKPTLGVIYFVLYYKKYFTSIRINNKNFVTTTVKNGDSYSWVHVEKEQKEK